MKVRGGRKRVHKSKKAIRAWLRSQVMAGFGHKPEGTQQLLDTGTASGKSLFFGSKAYKTDADRRPAKGGKVHFEPKQETRGRRSRLVRSAEEVVAVMVSRVHEAVS